MPPWNMPTRIARIQNSTADFRKNAAKNTMHMYATTAAVIITLQPKDHELKLEEMDHAYEDKDGVLVNAGPFTGMEMHKAMTQNTQPE